MTTDIYFDLKDKEKTMTMTLILTKLLTGIRSLYKIHSGHLFMLQIHFKVTENYQQGGGEGGGGGGYNG